MQLVIQQCDSVDISWLSEFLDINNLQQVSENDSLPEDFDGFILRCDVSGLSLFSPGGGKARPTQVDFESATLRHRVATIRNSEGLAKAVGLDKAKTPLQVIDATAGLGIDAFTLAAKGCHVTLLEKNPVMAALLSDGFRRGRDSVDSLVNKAMSHMTLVHSDAQSFFRQQGVQPPEVIFLDPMFPPRQKSASVKKDISLMQSLLPPNEDVAELLSQARELAVKRVVLKQPGKAGKAGKLGKLGKLGKSEDEKPDFVVAGKACHFQVFLNHH